MTEVGDLIERIKSTDKKVRYAALEQIQTLSRSKKRKQKIELLKILHEKVSHSDWEERYVSMYGISRLWWRNGSFDDFQKTYNQVIRLLEDQDGRVRIAAFNALEHFRCFFVMCVYGGHSSIKEKDVARLWMESLLLLGDKVDALEEGKQQHFLIKCVDNLFRSDMEQYLTKTECRKYKKIQNRLQELNELYNEFGSEK